MMMKSYLDIILAVDHEDNDLYELKNVVIPLDGSRISHIAVTIEPFTPSQFWQRFRIRKPDLRSYSCYYSVFIMLLSLLAH